MIWLWLTSYTNPNFQLLGELITFKVTLMQICKSSNIFALVWKWYVENFTLKHLLLFEIYAREMCEKFVYKHSETIEYVKS